jgi:hypothetical protein
MKRMLERRGSDFYVNASSVDIIQTCPRKAQYALVRNLRKEDESEALVFGKAIHSALETLYRTDPAKRSLSDMIAAFETAGASLSIVPDGEKRSLSNGVKILNRYFAAYANDPWVIYSDKDGPWVERSFELPFKTHNKFTSVFVHGQMDAVMQNVETGELVVVDHKTTSTVSDLINRVKPNLQFSLYAWAAKEMGLPVNRVMVNGIQVAKTKSDFLRIFTDRGADDFAELDLSITHAVEQYDKFSASESWPMNTSSCSNYGGCQYLGICQLDKALKENAIRAQYGG